MDSSKIIGPGWHLSEEGLRLVTENGQIKDSKTILQNALNTDLKEIGAAVLSSELSKSRIDQLVLQVQKVRNVAAPKANEDSQAAPRMLKLTLTDGLNFCQAIEINSIPAISRDRTSPGSKVMIKNAKVVAGYVLLQASSCVYLGGKVPALYEKWELSKSLMKSARQTSTLDGPPPWVNFGSKIVSSIQDQTFKSLDNRDKETNKQNTEFEVLRKDAIAEASTGAVKKVFGGGVKKPSNFQQQEVDRKPRFNREKNNRERGKVPEVKERNLEKMQKPVERVSLFDFLEEKLPASETTEAKPSESVQQIPSRQYQDYRRPASYNTSENVNNTNRKPYQKEYNTYTNTPSQNYRGNKQRETSNKPFDNKERPPRFFNKKDPSAAPIAKTYTPRTENGYTYTKPPQTKTKDDTTSASVDALANNMEKVSLNSQFATRSLRQHLNLGSGRNDKQEKESSLQWKTGDSCLAKYWEDGKFYNATVTDVTDKTCVVHFKDYGNMEEVLKSDCKPFTRKPKSYYSGYQNQSNQSTSFNSDASVFRRNTSKQC